MSAAMGFFSKELKDEFETAAVNELSLFEPLKFYCIGDVCCGMGPLSNSEGHLSTGFEIHKKNFYPTVI